MKLNPHHSKFSFLLGFSFLASFSMADVAMDVSVNSLYVDRGVQIADLTWHPSAEFSQGDFYSGLWVAQPLEKTGAPDFFADELDLYVGYGWALGHKSALDVGVTRHWISGSDASTEAYVGFAAELGTFAPTVYFYNDFDLDEFVVEATTTVAIPLEGFPVEATGRLGFVDGESDYRFIGVDVIYPVELSDSARLAFGLHYSSNDLGEAVPDSNLYGSASFSIGF